MQLERYNHFCESMKTDEDVQQLVVSIDMFRLFEGKWFAQADAIVDDEILCANLQHTLEIATRYREPNSTTAFVAIPELSAVAQAEFVNPPRSRSLERLQARLDECRRNAGHAFDAKHDAMTGLLNAKGFADAVEELSAIGEQDLETYAIATATSEASTLALLALDIDHFKQVNDTFGHMYGDVVIKTLAKRLTICASYLKESSDGSLDIRVARPSGEEFLILISGLFDMDGLKEHAERIRLAIAERPLPDMEEWSVLASDDLKRTPPPAIASRQVTISIGASSMATPLRSDARKTADSLRSQADLALYSAKSGGRNVVRHFSDLLQRYGRVLEHHPDTRLVAIDLGRNVNVLVGQEFHVYHPHFDGRTPFTRADGRTVKKLGVYPKRTVGRIVVIEVQQDISFCQVMSLECSGLFPEGSLLEAIPVGSIAHLIASPQFGGLPASLDLCSPEQFAKHISEIAKAKSTPVVAVFALNDIEELMQARGAAFINESLAQLFTAMKDVLPSASRFGQIQSTELAVAADLKRVDAVSSVRKVIESAISRCHGLARFSAGVYVDPPVAPVKVDSDNSSLKREHALDYARFAATEAAIEKDGVRSFSPQTAVSIMRHLRNKQLYRQGVEDYKRFRELGVCNASVENYASICSFALSDPDGDLILEAAKRAVELGPDQPVYIGNLGLFQFKFGDPVVANATFNALVESHPDHVLSDRFRRVRAMAAYAAYKHGENVDAEHLHRELSEVRQQKSVQFGIQHSEIDDAIQDLDQRRSANVLPTDSSDEEQLKNDISKVGQDV